ncbi:hypothetical protein JB92DRAFT_2803972 [Gautieria morchelliformis]|nr:hypothetical protein JB92DRAFT_2803972 [Gautieria morchelliformis]
MALQPSLRFLQVAGESSSPHTLEASASALFLDYVCPFSAKIARSVEHHLKPMVGSGGKYDGKVRVIVRLHPQPWHGSSTYTHEAALAVGRVDPSAFWKYTLALFETQTDYFDRPASTMTPLQIREKLVELASHHISKSDVGKMVELLKLKSTPNGGIGVTDDLKYNIKYSRANSIHVSPTALWDGLVSGEVSSSFGEKEWAAFLEQKVIS